MNHLKLTHDKLSVEAISELVVSPNCGAVSLFVGTTRDFFENKKVISLEYEAYESMALKVLEELCQELRKQWKNVVNIAIYHRLGPVPVKESSVVIAISSPHRSDSIKATEWCIDTLKKSVPIWKKELYENNESSWKENKESSDSDTIPSKRSKINIDSIEQKVEIQQVAPHLIQIKATNREIGDRIEKFTERKRNEININNISEFCSGDRHSEFICARIDATLQRRKDSKGHLQVDRVLNTYHRDQLNSDYLTKYIPPNGVEERIQNLESQLSLTTCTPRNIYERLRILEDRMLKLESISPEYIQLWNKINVKQSSKPLKKKIFSVDEIDYFISQLQEEK